MIRAVIEEHEFWVADFPPTESRSTLEISITRCGAPLPRACGLAQGYLCRHQSLQITLPADSSATLILRHPNLAVLSLALKMLSLLGSATAFQGATLRSGAASRAAVSMAVEDLVGGINDPIFGGTPEGKVWDPLGLGADEAALYRRRVVEIKHGRICMVAFLGMTVGPNDVRRAATLTPALCSSTASPPPANAFRHPPSGCRCLTPHLPPASAADPADAPAAVAVARPALRRYPGRHCGPGCRAGRWLAADHCARGRPRAHDRQAGLHQDAG